MDRSGVIGIFDSGVGGLSVWLELVHQLPHERTIYLADQAHVPYGSRSLSEVRAYSEAITRFLLAEGAKVIVIACNTASAAALHHLRRVFPAIPFVGMEPAVKPAAECTRTGVVGVMATSATFRGELFSSLLERYAGGVKVVTQICPGLVEAVERGALDSPETDYLLQQCLSPLLAAGIDQLVLGCTHYPFLRAAIQRIVGASVTVIDPAPAVARQTGRVLRDVRLTAVAGLANHVLYTTGQPERFAKQILTLIPAYADGLDMRSVFWGAGALAHPPSR
jgi:glutamate racemase